MARDVAYTRDGYRCDELYRAKVPWLNVNGKRLAIGDTFYPTEDMVLGALLASVFVGKVRSKKPKVSAKNDDE